MAGKPGRMDYGGLAANPDAQSAAATLSAAGAVAVAAVLPITCRETAGNNHNKPRVRFGDMSSSGRENTHQQHTQHHHNRHHYQYQPRTPPDMSGSRLEIMLAEEAAKRNSLKRPPGQTVIFIGTVVHATKDSPLEILRDRVLGVQDGKVLFLEDECEYQHLKMEHDISDEQVIRLGPCEFLIPGFVDAHIHAPQYVHAGAGMNLPPGERLKKFILTTEGGFSDVIFAEEVYHRVVDRLLKNGTTTACYFGTIHLLSTLKLCDIVEERGQRAFVGRCSALRNVPGFLVEEEDQSLKDTDKFVKNVLARENGLLSPLITVNSADCSTISHMTKLAALAKKHNLPFQTHVAETKDGHKKCRKLYPEHKHFTDVYESSGMLEPWTSVVNGTHLSDDEISVMFKRGVGVVHCPTTNMSGQSGICDVRQLLDKGVKVGMGTDISSGYSHSMLNVIRHAMHASNAVSNGKQSDYVPLDFREAFRLATLGSSEVLGLQDTIGNFEVGKDFDALRINPYVPDSPLDLFSKDVFEHSIEKFLYLGDDRNITEVYVAGKKVIDKTTPVIVNNGHG